MIALCSQRSVQCCVILLCGLCLNSGCRTWGWWHRDETAASETCDLQGPVPPNRRVFVVTGPGHHDGQELFVAEVVAALQSHQQCEVVHLPIHDPAFDPMTGEFTIDPVKWPPISVTPDTVLTIRVTELFPFRPMRLSADVELRYAVGGHVVYRDTRTWQAPVDVEPMPPGRLNRKILNHPLPPGIQEHEELSRLSPRTFMGNVARGLAQELLAVPL